MELQPPIFVAGIRIGEPVTALTDLLVTATCFYAASKLSAVNRSSTKFFRWYFVLLGLATFWGALVTHAFIFYLSPEWKMPGWILSAISVSIFAFASLHFHGTELRKISRFVVPIIAAELLSVIVAILLTNEFRWAGFHSAFGLVGIVLLVNIWSFSKKRDLGSRSIIMGIFLFLVSGLAFTCQWKIDTWFNHVDLTHVLLSIAAFIIYMGVEEKFRNEPK